MWLIATAALICALPVRVWANPAGMPDVIVVGEEHGNEKYRNMILLSLPGLLEKGYTKFAAEKPIDLQEPVDRYVGAVMGFDNEARTRSLWEIAAAVVGRKIPSKLKVFGKTTVPGAERIEAVLRPLVDAKVAGMSIQLVDLDTARMAGYAHSISGSGVELAEAGLHSTLEARNAHMAGHIGPGTLLLVGRAHTGKGDGTVEHFIRKRGLSVVSVDLRGSDSGSYPDNSEDADYSAGVEDILEDGGIVGFVAKRMPPPPRPAGEGGGGHR